MRKVLYITNIPSPYRVDFFNDLSKKVDLTVAFEMERAQNRDKSWKNDEVYCFHVVFMRSIYRKTEGAFCPEVISLIKAYKQEIIVVGGYSTPTGMYSILYMKLHHIPFLLNCDGGIIKSDSKIKKKIKSFFISAATNWLSTGKMADKYLIYYGAKKKRIFHYPFTSVKESDIIETTQNEKMKIRKQLGIQEEKVILFVGSFIYRKGIDILLRAAKNINNAALVLVGGDDLSEYQEILEEGLGCTLYVVGFKSKEEIKLYYQTATVFVLPTREDIWGLVINEAMAYGLPTITTNRCIAGLELIEDGINGYIVPVENPKILGERINGALEDDVLRKSMKEAVLKKIKNYTIEQMSDAHMEIFKNLI